MSNLTGGMKAGFIATVVLSVLMLLKSAMGLMPEINVISMLAGMLGGSVLMAWIAHFVIGTVLWGGLFAVLYDKIPGHDGLIKGVLFGDAAWLLMMVLVMPMAGAGFFGLALGFMAPVMTLILHTIFGAVLGMVYKPDPVVV